MFFFCRINGKEISKKFQRRFVFLESFAPKGQCGAARAGGTGDGGSRSFAVVLEVANYVRADNRLCCMVGVGIGNGFLR